MSIFIADHLGELTAKNKLVRPIHIGAATCKPSERGPEPDCATADNLSDTVSFSDLRMHYYVAQLDLPNDQTIAIMQYRRMFFLGRPYWFQRRLRRVTRQLQEGVSEACPVRWKRRNAYLKHLNRVRQGDLDRVLSGANFVVSGHRLSTQGLQDAYLKYCAVSHPDQTAYVDAFLAMREVLEGKVDPHLVSSALEGRQGYFHNMMVCRFSDFKSYTGFLFGVLDELKEFQTTPRLMGYLAERILPVFLASRMQQDPACLIKEQKIMFFV